MTQRSSIDGRVVVITGASSGIGRETARAFAARGDYVVLAARRADALESVLAEVGGHGRTVVCDVSRPRDVAALAMSVANTEGRCDVLVNNAGIGARSPFDGPDALEVTERVLRTNLHGPMHCTAHLLPLLRQSDRAAVVNVASIAGFIGFAGAPVYCATKFALRGWSEALHHALRREGIHVATVNPGPIPTPGWPHEKLTQHPFHRLFIANADAVARRIVRAADGRFTTTTIPRIYGVASWLISALPPLRTVALRVAANRRVDPRPASQ